MININDELQWCEVRDLITVETLQEAHGTLTHSSKDSMLETAERINEQQLIASIEHILKYFLHESNYNDWINKTYGR